MQSQFGKQLISKILLAVILLSGASFVVAKVYPYYTSACSRPLNYSIGAFDDRFGVSREDFLDAISQAEKIWEGPTQKELFNYIADDPSLKINLVYDYRQEATDKLQNLGFKIENTQSSYNNLKSRYDSLTLSYNERKSALDAKISLFDARKATYEQQVEKWNKQGGAPKSEADKLSAEYKALNSQATQINSEKDSINNLVNEINALVGILNNLASQLKLNVSAYNTIGTSRGEEFEEGVYVRDETGSNINIFEFSDQAQLIRLLAHELGHALGLEHVEDADSIMYRLNQAKNDTLTSADLSELSRVCKMSF